MGVKSLWTLLAPVGRPVMLETTEGKSMAIDSSIWIYQFQATMRDKEGRALNNAHVLGFLRRISKLLFYGIKPVFVFDGGAPVLKRNTLNERRKKKSGAAANHHKLAEKLLAAQMRREALNHAQRKPKTKQTRQVELNDETVYLEDLDGTAPRTPAKRKAPTPSSSSTKKSNFRDHDPYNLPEVNMDEVVSKATRSAAPDPRLATEDELRAFIEDMRPGDFDIHSPAFRELPTEVQYEIIGDLRLKSRQTSYDRLHKMLKSAKTPMDFSKQQILNLKQRNNLTQQLLMTTDSIGSAHIAIPVRIASERNREYILMKNEGEDGGWILGIKDIGTKEKPIVLDHDEPKADPGEDSDADMEEVQVPMSVAPDPDLREYQREMALTGISNRNTDKGLLPLTSRPINRKGKSTALIEALQTEATAPASPLPQHIESDSDSDDLIAYAIQASLDQTSLPRPSSGSTPSKTLQKKLSDSKEDSSDDDIYVDFSPPTRLQTVLSMANASPSVTRTPSRKVETSFGKPPLLSSSRPSSPSPETFGNSHSAIASQTDTTAASTIRPQETFNAGVSFGKPTLLASPKSSAAAPVISDKEIEHFPVSVGVSDSGDEDMEEVILSIQASQRDESEEITFESSRRVDLSDVSVTTPPSRSARENFTDINLQQASKPLEVDSIDKGALSESDEDMEAVPVGIEQPQPRQQPRVLQPDDSSELMSKPLSPAPSEYIIESADVSAPATRQPSIQHQTTPPSPDTFQNNNATEPLFTLSRSPSPSAEMQDVPGHAEDWDAAQEMDAHAEEGEFAQFMSQVKGRNVEDVRKEIDEEIKTLNQQRKAAIRDSEDITQQMIAQIMTMLRLFGIPYITAPMEAEAQCAELVSLRLVDGVITDDSDVFLFGAQRVYKNMFNQSKTVECFMSTDLSRELGLDRDTLIQLAYLLGSDYTEGLPGVGPVVAMELLKEFPGRNGLFKFKDWWVKVQSGRDQEQDTNTKFRKQFKKRFKNLYLADDWPNSVVRDAYYHPAVDSSDEPFKWGMPDLDGLRDFFQAELGWRQNKVDELLLPIIQKMNKRNQAAALNRQGNLNEFLDISAGGGTYAPRQRQAYASNRLQQVISDFRKRQKSGSATPQSKPTSDNEGENDGSGSDQGPPAKKPKKKAASAVEKGSKSKAKAKAKAVTSTTRSRGKGKNTRTRRAKSKESSTSDENLSAADDQYIPATTETGNPHRTTELNLRPRPRPRPRTGAVPVDGDTDVVGGRESSTDIPQAQL